MYTTNMQFSSQNTHHHPHDVHEYWQTASQYEPEIVLQELIGNITSNVVSMKSWSTSKLVEWLAQLNFLGDNHLVCSTVSQLCIDGNTFERIINSKKRLFRVLKLHPVDRERIRVILFEWKHVTSVDPDVNSTTVVDTDNNRSVFSSDKISNSDYTPIGRRYILLSLL